MNIEEIWPDNAWRGLWGEVVEGDIYKIKQLKFVPDVIFDLGANVGTFSKFARELFPNALIVAVEPDPKNIEHFKEYFNPDENNTVLYEFAIGNGTVYRDTKAANGSHECYLSPFMGYEDIAEGDTLVKTKTESLVLDFCLKYTADKKFMFKIDIEGSETAIFEDELSMEILGRADYIAMEIHYFAMTPNGVLQVMELTHRAMETLAQTHDTIYEHPIFYATKKQC